ncbi:MAG: FlgD immunoglobulin-like domain containing protein, partial [Candidatus Latescibacterota bacterium]
AVFEASTYLTGQVFDSRGTRLPQTITPGDANPEVSTNSIQVRSSEAQLSVLEGVTLQPAAISPNGDGINDELRIGFDLFGVERAEVELGVFDLAGSRIARLRPEGSSAGRHAVTWNGRDEAGNLAPPGVYLVRIEVKVDQGVRQEMRPVAVVY